MKCDRCGKDGWWGLCGPCQKEERDFQDSLRDVEKEEGDLLIERWIYARHPSWLVRAGLLVLSSYNEETIPKEWEDPVPDWAKEWIQKRVEDYERWIEKDEKNKGTSHEA